MSIPRPEQTEIIGIDELPVARREPPDPLRRILIADCLLLFALLAIAAPLTPISWLALTETIAAIVSLIAAGCYWLNRNF